MYGTTVNILIDVDNLDDWLTVHRSITLPDFLNQWNIS